MNIYKSYSPGKVLPNTFLNQYQQIRICRLREGIGYVITPFIAIMTGHRHSMWTPGLLKSLKSSGTFEARPQQRHILRHWSRHGKKGPASVSKKRTSVHARMVERKESRRNEVAWRWSDQQTPEKRPTYYEHIKKSQGAILRSPVLQFFAPYTSRVTSINCGHLSIFLVLTVVPLRRRYEITLRLPFFCLFHFSFFRNSYHSAPLPLLPLSIAGADQSMQNFCVDRGLTEGPRSHLWALKRVVNITNKKQLTVAN